MRRAAATVLGAAVLTLPYAPAAAAVTKKPKIKVTTRSTTATYDGDAAEADRWGTVQVTIVVRTTTTTTKTTVGTKTTTKTKVARKITDLKASYEVHTDRSQFIMEQALPILRQEALTAQNANVQLVSHATDTSYAFVQSLQSALAKM